jgi:alkanesulfonate monooxygenase SsuD/methylene tetrahydromethanopterin reductase-like flavin-dependent oxidoreductase (luciferase family)
MEIGLYSFVEIPRDSATGLAALGAQRMRDLLEEIELADQVGLDVFGVGEHHRPEFIASAQFAPLIALYREAAKRAGKESTARVGINSHTFIATNGREAADTFFPPYAEAMSRIGRERGWPPTTRQQFDASRAPHGSLLVGSAQEVIDKILYERELFHHDRFLAQMTVGPVPHEKVMRSIELLGTVVAPAIRQATTG